MTIIDEDTTVRVDGIDYNVNIRNNGRVVRLFDTRMRLLAVAEFQSDVEQLFVDLYDSASEQPELNYFEWIDKERKELARQIAAML